MCQVFRYADRAGLKPCVFVVEYRWDLGQVSDDVIALVLGDGECVGGYCRGRPFATYRHNLFWLALYLPPGVYAYWQAEFVCRPCHRHLTAVDDACGHRAALPEPPG